jgi:hypothetical protein
MFCLQAAEAQTFPFKVEPGKDRTIVIEWNVPPQADHLEYNIEKSTDMRTWQTIAHILPQMSHNYTCIDSAPSAGINYYRIGRIALGNQILFSQVKWIQVADVARLYIWPSPAKDMLHIKCPFTTGTMNIVDRDGKFLYKITIINYITDIPLDRFPKGMYYLSVIHASESLVVKFLKQ